MNLRKAFTLIELLVVIAIIAILAVVVVLVLNPAELLRQSRDSNRVSDMSTLTSVLGDYSTDQSGSASFNMGSSSVVYVSIPDPSATSTAGDQCQGLGLITLPATYTYHCAATNSSRSVNGTGWIPVNLTKMSTGSPLGSLPVDPSNTSSSRLYYTYTTNGAQFEVTAPMESQKYGVGGSNDVITPDGGPLATVYEKGSLLGLEPLDYGDTTLVGYWPVDEGVGGIAYDDSGNGMDMVWQGAQAGTSGYYSPGKVQSWAGYFNGSNDTATTTNAASSAAAYLTVTAWFDPLSFPTSSGHIFLAYNGVPGLSGYGFGFNALYDCTPGNTIDVWVSGISCFATNGYVGISTGTWTFAALTGNAYFWTLYVNGSAVGGTGSTAASAAPTADAFLASTNFTGYVNNVRIYRRVLSAAQIAAMYNAEK